MAEAVAVADRVAMEEGEGLGGVEAEREPPIPSPSLWEGVPGLEWVRVGLAEAVVVEVAEGVFVRVRAGERVEEGLPLGDPEPLGVEE